MPKKRGLTPQQQRAIIELLQRPTIRAAARYAEVPERTLHYWLNQHEFLEALRGAQGRAMDEALAEIEGSSKLAVRTLREVMYDVSAAPGARASAARTTLQLASRIAFLRNLHGEPPAAPSPEVKEIEGKAKSEA